MSENVKSKLNLDSRNLERDVLTPEQRREDCDSRPRVKIKKKGSSRPDVTPGFGGPTTSISETPYYQALEKLAKSANDWMTLKRSLTQKQGAKALKTLTDRITVLAASLRSNLTLGILRFRSDKPKLTNSKSQSNLHNLLLLDPSKVETFRKSLDRRSGKELFRTFNEHIVNFGKHLYYSIGQSYPEKPYSS